MRTVSVLLWVPSSPPTGVGLIQQESNMSEDAEQYNGWANRETWAASLHLSNDRGLDGMVTEWATELLERYQQDDTVLNIPLRATSHLAERISDQFDEWAADIAEGKDEWGEPIPAAITAAVFEVGSRWRVDWRAVAESYVAAALEDED